MQYLTLYHELRYFSQVNIIIIVYAMLSYIHTAIFHVTHSLGLVISYAIIATHL